MLEIRTFSPGACSPTISGPIEIISTPSSFWPSTAHSSPPWTTTSSGSLPNSRSKTAAVLRRSSESSRGSQGGYERRTSITASPVSCERFHPREQVVEGRGVRAPRHRGEQQLPGLGSGDGEADARLDAVGPVGAHRDGARRDRGEELEDATRLLGTCGLLRSGRLELEHEFVVRARVLPDDRGELGAGGKLERVHVRDSDDCLSGPRDRVAAHAAVEAHEPERRRLEGRLEYLPERLDRVHAARGDVGTRVPAPCAGELHAQRWFCTTAVRQREPDRRMVAAGAAHGHGVARAVEVDEQPPRHERGVERLRSVEPLLLGDGQEQLEWPVRHRRVLGERQRERDADAVVGAERRPVGPHPVVVDVDVDPSLARIEPTVRIALAHHVEVRLEDDDRRGLPPGRGRDRDDDVPLCIRGGCHTSLRRPGEDVLPHLLLLLSTVERCGSARRSAPRRAPARARRAANSPSEREDCADAEERRARAPAASRR